MIGHISGESAAHKPNVALVQTVDGSTTKWTPAAHRLFTVTGVVKLVSYFGDVDETLTEENGAETIEVGIAGNTALIIAQLAAPANLATGDIWVLTTVLPGAVLADPIVIADTDIDLVVAGGTGIDDGQITFYVEWEPISSGALLVPAVWD